MESQLVSFEKEIEPERINRKEMLVMICSIFIVCLLISGLIYVYLLLVDSHKQISSISKELGTMKTDIEEIKKSPSDSDLKSRIDNISLDSYISRLQHQIEGGVVTDDFVVEKITITSVPPIREGGQSILDTTMDLSVQPGSNSKYIGQSKFGITDRELKSKIQDVLDEVSKRYNRGINLLYKDKGLLSWEKGSHLVTVKNYEIGRFENGKFTLKGE